MKGVAFVDLGTKSRFVPRSGTNMGIRAADRGSMLLMAECNCHMYTCLVKLLKKPDKGCRAGQCCNQPALWRSETRRVFELALRQGSKATCVSEFDNSPSCFVRIQSVNQTSRQAGNQTSRQADKQAIRQAGSASTYLGQAITEICIHGNKCGLCHCTLKDQRDGGVEDLSGGHHIHQLLKQALKLFGGQLVQCALDSLDSLQAQSLAEERSSRASVQKQDRALFETSEPAPSCSTACTAVHCYVSMLFESFAVETDWSLTHRAS